MGCNCAKKRTTQVTKVVKPTQTNGDVKKTVSPLTPTKTIRRIIRRVGR